MRKLILGLSIFGHDSSATLIDCNNGKVLYALTEERFSNIKHDGKFPAACIKNIEKKIKDESLGIISYVGINANDKKVLEYLYFLLTKKLPNNAYISIRNVLAETYNFTIRYEENAYPITYVKSILSAAEIPHQLAQHIVNIIIWYGNLSINIKWIFTYLKNRFPSSEIIAIDHHACHLASAYFSSGYQSAAILSIDGQGEAETALLAIAQGNKITTVSSTKWPHSLGAFYMHLTYYLGFRGNTRYPGFGEEYKVMGMAAYGKPTYLDVFLELADIDTEGRITFNIEKYLTEDEVYGCPGHTELKFTQEFISILGEPRQPFDEITQNHFNIAKSAQRFIEILGVKLTKTLKKISNKENLCIAGGVGLNGLMNEQIRKYSGFKNLFIFPAAGDDGGSFGAAMHVYHSVLDKQKNIGFKNAFLGLKYQDEDLINILTKNKIIYTKPLSINRVAAELLLKGNIVARYNDRSEFGPRALGNRSILANPSLSDMKDIINKRIKHREKFRPFAPACLEEHAASYFDIDTIAPYMLLICKTKEEKKEFIPAVVHVDGTARLQTVSKDQNPSFYELLSHFHELSGIPMLVNTSFNVNGEAIVETPLDALESFLFMDIDFLILGDYLISKEKNIDKSINLTIEEFILRRNNRYKLEYSSHELYIDPSELIVDTSLNQQIKILESVCADRLQLINKLDADLKSCLDHNNKPGII